MINAIGLVEFKMKTLHQRDLKLIGALLVISFLAVAVTWQGSRIFEEKLLKERAELEATHWAEFLHSRFSDLDGILDQGAISAEDRDLLDFASEAGRIFRYKFFDAEGKIVVASRSADLGKVNTKPYFAEVVQKGGNYVKVVVKDRNEVGSNDLSGKSEISSADLEDKATISEAYVPFMKNGKFVGAVEVYVDATSMAASYRTWSNNAVMALALIFLVMGICLALFIFHNIRDRNRDFAKVEAAHRVAKEAEKNLLELNDHLEQRVSERTEELNNALREVSVLNKELEDRVEERTQELQNAQQDLVRNERLAALGQLTATVSHELRNPLGALRTALFLIQSKTKDKELGLDRAFQRADRSIDRCDNIITEMLDFARATDISAETASLDEWLDGVIEDQVLMDGLVLERKADARSAAVDFDSDRLRRAVINVFENGRDAIVETMKASDGGRQGVLKVATAVRDGRVEMAFTDNGPGMDEEVLSKVFEPLFSTKSFGVGLGMPTVKQIMELHGGGIEVSSEPGEGTTVVLWLPIKETRSEEAAA